MNSFRGTETTIGQYTLLAKVGEGGMGFVHLAHGPDGRRVAVKILRPHVVGDDHGRARMAREVTSMRRVRSPRVAEVYDADPWGDTPYVVTRFVEGPSLHDHVDANGPIRGDGLLVLARGLAEALVAVHAADVLHRDVKPSNVLLEAGQPVLIDFGLAQLADDSKLTHSGWMMGTPGYLAPEIVFGDDATPKADVHSWAATLVFAATGRGPYGKGPAVVVMDRVRRGEYDLAGVPDELYWIVSRGLMPDPRDRPTSSELVEWLSRTPAVMPRPAIVAPTTVPSAPERPAPSPPEQVVSSPEQVATGRPTVTPWPPHRHAPGPTATMLFWVGVLALIVAGAVTAPGITAIALFCTAWLLRTLTFRDRRLARWRTQRGRRHNDGVTATVCLPWFGVLTLPAAVVNGGLAVLDGAIVVVLAIVAIDAGTLAPFLALGALVAALFVWWGPLSADVRSGGRIATGAMLKPGGTTVLVLFVLAALVIGLVTVRLAAGPDYDPLPHPPWEQSLRSLVS